MKWEYIESSKKKRAKTYVKTRKQLQNAYDY